jgi:hypothetical protein
MQIVEKEDPMSLAKAKSLVQSWRLTNIKKEIDMYLHNNRHSKPTLHDLEKAIQEKGWKKHTAKKIASMWTPIQHRPKATQSAVWMQHVFKNGKSWPGFLVNNTENIDRGVFACNSLPNRKLCAITLESSKTNPPRPTNP